MQFRSSIMRNMSFCARFIFTLVMAYLATESQADNLGSGDCVVNCMPDEKTERAICATDGKVYGSWCAMRIAVCGGQNITEAVSWETCRGHSLCPSACLRIRDPVCSVDGKIYQNKCLMQQQNCGVHMEETDMKKCLARSRQGRRLDPCPKQCSDLQQPVCASDGSNRKVYYNECEMRKENCGKRINMLPMSRCIEIPKCPRVCIALYDPVCGSDKRIYLNHCRLRKANCGNEVVRRPRSFCVGEENVDKL